MGETLVLSTFFLLLFSSRSSHRPAAQTSGAVTFHSAAGGADNSSPRDWQSVVSVSPAQLPQGVEDSCKVPLLRLGGNFKPCCMQAKRRHISFGLAEKPFILVKPVNPG